MKRLIYILIAITFNGCSDSDSENYSLLSEELEDSVYLEAGTEISNGISYNYSVYYTFDFEKYAYITNSVTEAPSRSGCYSLFWVSDGALVSDSKNSLTYIKNNMTYTITKISKNVLRIQRQGSSSNLSWEIIKSDFVSLENAKKGKKPCN